MSIRVNVPGAEYRAHVVGALADAVTSEVIPADLIGKQVAILTDDVVGPLYEEHVHDWLDGAGLAVVGTHRFQAGEGSKKLADVQRTLDFLATRELDREGLVLGLGGGVVGDLAGFVASIYRRGVAVAHLPSTLLAQVDSSVGGKTGVNLKSGKNLVGTFLQPRFVLAVTDFLSTLEPRIFRSGLGEAVKYGVLGDPELLDWIGGRRPRRPDELSSEDRRELVSRCLAAKADVVATDEKDAGPRRVLNLGHTLGHALEQATGYSDALLHGEAVAIGMVFAARLAEARGMSPAGTATRIETVLSECGLPTGIPIGVDGGTLLASIRQDKKRSGGQMVWVLPTGIGRVEVVTDITENEIHAVISS